MFNLKKLIQMVKNGKFLIKPFNVRKKAAYQWGGEKIYDPTDEPTDDPRDVSEISDEDVDKRRGLAPNLRGKERAFSTTEFDYEQIAIDQAAQEKREKGEATEEGMESVQIEVESEMDQWIQLNEKNLINILAQDEEVLENRFKNPKISLVPPSDRLGEALRNYRGFIGILENKIKPIVPPKLQTPEMPKKISILVNTVLAKYNEGVFKETEVEEEVFIGYDDTTKNVLTRFHPKKLSKVKGKDGFSDYDRVLDALRGKGDEVGRGTGVMYNETDCARAISRTFGVPRGNDLDKRMNFFLKNADKLDDKYIFEENQKVPMTIFQKVPQLEKKLREGLESLKIYKPTVVEGLGVVTDKTAADLEGKRSPRSVMTKLLKELAGDELLEILGQLTERLDSSIVQWFKPALFFVDKEENKKLKQRGEALTTQEEEDYSVRQVRSVVENYLNKQIEVMDIMKDSTTTSLMESEYDKYMELKPTFSQMPPPDPNLTKIQQANQKIAIEKGVAKQLENYTTIEFLNGFTGFAIEKMRELLKTKGTANKPEYSTSGKEENTNVRFLNKYGEINIGEEAIHDIFKMDNADDIITPESYVNKYIEEINNGNISEPWGVNWARAINKRVVYDVLADMFMTKSQIKEAYKGAKKRALRQEGYGGGSSGEDLITSVYNEMNEYPESRAMLENFSGIAYEEKAVPSIVEEKKKNFIKATLDQTEANLKRHRECYESREKYNKLVADVENDISLTEDEKKIKEAAIRTQEKRKSVLYSIKQDVGAKMGMILPSVLNAMQNSQAPSIYERNAENKFLQLFDSDSSKFERHTGFGKQPNLWDEEGRSNTELYHAILNKGKTPKSIKEIGDFSKAVKKIGKPTAIDNKYHDNLVNIFLAKKKKREINKLLRQKKIYRENYINYKLIPGTARRVAYINSNPDDKKIINLLKKVPSARIREFNSILAGAYNKTMFPIDAYYSWLGLAQLVRGKQKKDKAVKEFEDSIDKIKVDIEKIEKANALLEPKTSPKTSLKTSPKRPYASGSYSRIVHAEYNKALSRINKLRKIKKFSYKFASVDTALIDDTILGIKKDFENLLDNSIR
jgi:hypothetical protein